MFPGVLDNVHATLEYIYSWEWYWIAMHLTSLPWTSSRHKDRRGEGPFTRRQMPPCLRTREMPLGAANLRRRCFFQVVTKFREKHRKTSKLVVSNLWMKKSWSRWQLIHRTYCSCWSLGAQANPSPRGCGALTHTSRDGQHKVLFFFFFSVAYNKNHVKPSKRWRHVSMYYSSWT